MHLPTAAVLAGLLLIAACDREPKTPAREDAPRAAEPPPAADEDAGHWAQRVTTVEATRAAALAKAAGLAPRAAVMSDDAEDSDELTSVTRLVYQVRFSVPGSFRDRRAPVSAPAGELHVDVSTDRLRGRFVGPGWPAADGSEVRLRADLPGVYLFDGFGGRSLSAGQLASWFEGRADDKAKTPLGIRRDYGPPHAKPIEVGLLCALLAEWSDQPRESVMPRCAHGSPPPGFRIGPWRADLTAVVPMSLARRALRADQAAPPKRAEARSSFGWLEAPALSRLLPTRFDAGDGTGTLVIENQTDTRAIVLAQGVPVGWVDAGAALRLHGLRAGFYRVGAIRPLGILRMRPKLVHVPGTVVMGRTEEPEN